MKDYPIDDFSPVTVSVNGFVIWLTITSISITMGVGPGCLHWIFCGVHVIEANSACAWWVGQQRNLSRATTSICREFSEEGGGACGPSYQINSVPSQFRTHNFTAVLFIIR